MIQVPEHVINATTEEQANFILVEMSRMLAEGLASIKVTSADPDLAVHSFGNNILLTEVINPR